MICFEVSVKYIYVILHSALQDQRILKIDDWVYGSSEINEIWKKKSLFCFESSLQKLQFVFYFYFIL